MPVWMRAEAASSVMEASVGRFGGVAARAVTVFAPFVYDPIGDAELDGPVHKMPPLLICQLFPSSDGPRLTFPPNMENSSVALLASPVGTYIPLTEASPETTIPNGTP